MRAPYKHNQRIRAVIAAAGAVALINGSIVLGLTGHGAAAEPDPVQKQQIEAPAPPRVGPALVRAAEGGADHRSRAAQTLEELVPRPEEQGRGLGSPRVPEAG
ncbi:hypothetical protein [Streptomyces sp. NPDC058401]|uniref:hypothetical protein n=1 Tax=Streptomyces sp. NPDC058401 TaxID=3346480 RepID=UPI003663EF64